MKKLLLKENLDEDIEATIEVLKKFQLQSNKTFFKLCKKSIEAIKKKIKFFFLVMEVVLLMLNIWQQKLQ